MALLNMTAAVLAAFTLVGPKDAATVVVPENAEPSTMLCVEELTNYVNKITGVTLKVNPSAVDLHLRPTPSLIIGTLETLKDVPAAAREALSKTKKLEAAWMGTDGGNLWIVGKESPADLYATYHFLETKLGVRWFQAAVPEDPGDYYPTINVRGKGLVIQDFQEFREPDFTKRVIGHQWAVADIIPVPGQTCGYRNGFQHGCYIDFRLTNPSNDSPAMAAHRKFYAPRISPHPSGSNGGHHTVVKVFPWKKYLKTDPELFALQDGVRGGKKGQTYQYCLSNPRLMDGVVKFYTDFYSKYNGIGGLGFGQTDEGHGWCECENCRALDGPHEDPYSNNPCVSSRICWFASHLFERLHEKFPKLTFNYEPYAVYRNYPEKGRLPPYTHCQVSPHGRCYKHCFGDPKCPRNAKLWKECLRWQEMLPNGLWTYEYFADTCPYYVCREKAEAEDLRLYKKSGFAGWYQEGFLTGARFMPSGLPHVPEVYPSNWQWIYATGHLLWKVDTDLDALLDDAESKYYGVAYPAMKKYHALRRKLWDERNECMGYPDGDPCRPLLLNADGAKEQLLAYLDEADRLAGGKNSLVGADGELKSPTPIFGPKCPMDFVPKERDDAAILRYRLSRDRYWLTTYWIKPNEKVRARAAEASTIPVAKAPVVIDGEANDVAWADALVLGPNRFLTQHDLERRHKPAPEQFATEIRIVRDGDSLCFLLLAKDTRTDLVAKGSRCKKNDEPVWGDSGLEMAIYPPSVENCYYHIAVNLNGVVYDARCPGNDTTYDLGVTGKGKIVSDKLWQLEVRVPSKHLYELTPGAKWRMQFSRSCTGGRSYDKSGDYGSYSLGGYPLHDAAEFYTFEIQ